MLGWSCVRLHRAVIAVALALLTVVLWSCGGHEAAGTSRGRARRVSVARDVAYRTSNGTAWTLDVYSPPDHKRGAADLLGAVVVIHGGGWVQGDKRDVEGSARGLAAAGFVAVAVDYSIPAPGKRFPAELEDCQKAVRWVQEHARELGIDPARVGVLGSSSGGNLAMMIGVLGTGSSTLPTIRAVASWSGISDLSTLAPADGRSHPKRPPSGCGSSTTCIGVATPAVFTDYLGCTLARCPSRYRAASPITFVSANSAPMYLAGSSDDFVPFDQSARMASALQGKGVEVRTDQIPGRAHGDALRGKVLEPTVTFFKQQLR